MPPRKPKADGTWQVRAEYSSRHYRRVSTRVWDDIRVRRFTAIGKLVWIHLLTAPSTTSIPGLFRMREEEAARLCGITLEEFREGFLEPYLEGMVEADWDAGVVWLKRAPRHEWPTGPNVVKGWRTVCASLPECRLVGQALRQIREELQRVFSNPEPFLKAFDEVFTDGFLDGFDQPFVDGYLEGLGKPIPAQDAGCRMQDAGVRKQESEAIPPHPPDGGGEDGGPARPELVLVPEESTRPESSRARKPKAEDEVSGAVLELQAAWNEVAEKHGLQRWVAMGARLKHARAAVAEVPDIGRWRAYLAAKMQEPFFLGKNDRGWKADVDWLLTAKVRAKVADFDPGVAPAIRTYNPRVGNVRAELADHVNDPITNL